MSHLFPDSLTDNQNLTKDYNYFKYKLIQSSSLRNLTKSQLDILFKNAEIKNIERAILQSYENDIIQINNIENKYLFSNISTVKSNSIKVIEKSSKNKNKKLSKNSV